MSGIPTYLNNRAPLHSTTASKPSGTTPQTAAPPQAPSHPQSSGTAAGTPASVPANIPRPTSTSATTTTNAYPSAQPGAGPSLPGPTPAPQLQQYIPSPTRTTKVDADDQPPAPQPGAAPIPPSAASNAPQAAIGGVSPPAAQPTSTATAGAQPSQAAFPGSPRTLTPNSQRTYGMPIKGTTATSTAASFANPSTAFVSPVPAPSVESSGQSLEHPPGYVQNPYASADLPPHVSGEDPFTTAGSRSASMDLRELVGVGGSGTNFGEGEGVWDSVKGWVGKAAEKVGEVEKEVWKRAFGDKD